MKQYFLAFLLLATSIGTARAIVANPDTARVTQPDGTVLSVVLHGDEFVSYTTTADGYTVLLDADGFYEYARLVGGCLSATGMRAHDAALRGEEEKTFLKTTPRHLAPEMTVEARRRRELLRQMTSTGILGTARSGGLRPKKLSGRYDYNKFRGLVILVEFNDCAFTRDDTHDLFNDMLNKKGFDGFMSDAMIPEKIPYTGSVRDYYYDNSMGMFDPVFDVVGPVSVNYSKSFPRKSTNAQTLMTAALRAADDLVDYSKYDTDGDRQVDMVFFIFAGAGSNFSGNDQSLLWPHASQIMGLSLDGVSFGRYACSTELYGREESKVIDGIGTVCHEFSHVLGLPDEYDTDYANSGGQSVHPGKWSVMAQGSYLNQSRTPCGYSLYERYSVGFARPETITGEGDFTLAPVSEANTGYRIDSSMPNEFFLIENRQHTKWDEYLPGHGMLVFRVDSTKTDVWENNNINVNPAHNYYELLRATPKQGSSGITDSDGDPFPGTGGVTVIDNNTSPGLRSWSGMSAKIIINGIAETGDGMIKFSTLKEDIRSDIEDFETMQPTEGDAAGVEGRFCKWTFVGSAVEIPDDPANCNGNKAVAMVKNAELTTSEISSPVQSLLFDFYNPTATTAYVRCYYSTNGGNSWTVIKNPDGLENVSVGAESMARLNFNVNAPAGSRYRIVEYIGSKTSKCYVDDVTAIYEKTTSAVKTLPVDGVTALSVRRDGNRLLISGAAIATPLYIYNAAGMMLKAVRPENGGTEVTLPGKGVYIIRQGSSAVKVQY